MTNPSDEGTIQALRDRMRGEVLRPGDQGYEVARTAWNGRFDGRPALAARCTGAADVMAALQFARERGLAPSVRSGGHDYAGTWVSDGGLLIDLSPMGAVRVDPARKRAWVQAGATWGAFDHEAQAFGLATTGVTVSTVGVAGSTLGGGTGYLSRKHGFALDNLEAAEVVTAGGELVRASEEENPDLFWALRGGGGNFGIVTSFEFRLHEVGPELLVAQAWHPVEAARDIFRFHREFMAGVPDEVQCYPFVLRVPPAEPFPEAFHGRAAVALVGCHAGAVGGGEAALQPLQDFGEPFLAAVQPTSYTILQQSFDAGMPKGNRWYTKTHYLRELSDQAIDVFADHASRLPGPFSMAYMEPMGGAIARIDPGATAFPHRNAPYSLHIFPGWTDPAEDDEMIRWAREFHEAMAPYATGGAYVNLLDGDEEDPAAAAWGQNRDRLRELKARWDPDNLFRMNHNIRPSA